MKSNLLIPRCLALGVASAAALGQSVSEDLAAALSGEALIGPHHQVVEWTSQELDHEGQTVDVADRYTVLATGLNWWNSAMGQWEPTVPDFEVTPDGYALAVRGQHKAILNLGNLNAGGSVDLELPGGQERLRSNPMGLAFYDEATGKNVLIAEVKDCAGELVAPNMVGYADAFESIWAAVRFRNSRSGFEQDVLIYGPGTASLDPADYGLNRATTRLEMYSEFFNPPEPQVVTRQIAEGLEDQEVNFGTMQLAEGSAYVLGQSLESVPVVKSWGRVKDSTAGDRVFLIESVPFEQVRPLFERAGVALRGPGKPDETLLARRQTQGREAQLARLSPRTVSPEVLVAKVEPKAWPSSSGVLLDWAILNTTQTNAWLRGDETYLVLDTVNLTGTNSVFEAGCVLKYTNSASAQVIVNTPLTWQATAYRPITLTARDDPSVGQSITPTNALSGYYANTALKIMTGNTQLRHLRVAHATLGIFFHDYSAGSGNRVSHAQFVNCGKALQFNGYGTYFQNFKAGNLLMVTVGTAFYGYSFAGTIEHLTLNGCTKLAEDYNGQGYGTTSSLSLVNSLLVGVSSYYGSRPVTINLNAPYTQERASSSGLFQSVGAGAHYLAADSTFRNAGTTSIDSQLLSDLRNRTTYPPIVLTSDFTTSTTLAPQAQRDTDTLDLGWHYDVLDYCWSGLNLTNATLTLTNGVAVGVYGIKGTVLRTGAKFSSEGRPDALNRLARYPAIQEQSTAWGGTASSLTFLELNSSTPVEARLAFTDIAFLGGTTSQRQLISGQGNYAAQPLALTHCQLRGAQVSYANTTLGYNNQVYWTNNLLERCSVSFSRPDLYTPTYLNLYNNLFTKGSVAFTTASYTPSWMVKDNLFDPDTLTKSGSLSFTNGNNGYRSGLTPLPGGSGDKTNLTLNFQSGPATNWYGVSGDFYYPTNGASNTLTALIDAGSATNAALRGLYHFTTTANQVKEGTSTNDIGYHYVASPKVQFVGTNTTTQGNWKGVYGADGYCVISNLTSYPPYATFTRTNAAEGQWPPIVPEIRMLEKASGPGRIAGVWYADTTFDILLQQTDARPHRLALYCLDGVTSNQYQQRIDIIDSATGTTCDSRTLTSFSAGVYLVWDICGNATIRVTDLASGYAVVTGLFFSESAGWLADVDMDGVPDYLEDRNGNGTVDSGETSWTSAQDAGLKVLITKPSATSNVP